MKLSFTATILQNEGMDAAYIEVPYDIKGLYGTGRLLADATFDGVPYRGQVVKMGTPCFIIGITKQIRRQIGKSFGDTVTVTIQEREKAAAPAWKCPQCGREFKVAHQQHYCLDKPATIDEYILRQDPEKQADLQLIRQVLRNALPDAQERMSWSMPTFWQGHNMIHFAASKQHIGLYPGPEAVEAFQDELTAYKTDKGTIRIPYGKVDPSLVDRIAKWCLLSMKP